MAHQGPFLFTCFHLSNIFPCRRHVMLPKDIAKLVPKTHLMSESEWRNLGVQQSQGWVHYMIHEPGKGGEWGFSTWGKMLPPAQSLLFACA